MLLILLVASAQGAWAQSGEWKDHAASGYASGSGTKTDPWIIKTAEELAFFSNKVYNKETYSGKYFILGADINLGAHYWNPIGKLGEVNSVFRGKFDGRGHVISNMHVLWDDHDHQNWVR